MRRWRIWKTIGRCDRKRNRSEYQFIDDGVCGAAGTWQISNGAWRITGWHLCGIGHCENQNDGIQILERMGHHGTVQWRMGSWIVSIWWRRNPYGFSIHGFVKLFNCFSIRWCGRSFIFFFLSIPFHSIGGCVAQEIIKLITKQYIPINNTFIYNAITSETAVFNL